MASEKKPSIYYDRSTIGSSDELDEYGVWVKSEPQDLSSVNSDIQDTADSTIADTEELPDLDLDSDLSFLDQTEVLDDDSGKSGDDSDFDDFSDLTVSFEDTGSEDGEAAGAEDATEDDFSFDASFDLDTPETDDESSFTEISMNDFLDESDTEKAETTPENDTESPDTDIPDLDIDFNDLEELDTSLDFDTEDSGTDQDEDSGISMDLGDDFSSDLPDMPDLALDEDDTAEAKSSEDAGISEADIDFDDVAAFGQELQSSDSSPEEEPAHAAETPKADLSTELLVKIADELSSIKAELSSLKQELAAYTEHEGAEPAEAADKGDNRGFFDEEDDDKISLTGDELDNILNTADFTEEAGQDATVSLENDDFPSFDIDSVDTLTVPDEESDITAGKSDDFMVDEPDILTEEAPAAEDDLLLEEPDMALTEDEIAESITGDAAEPEIHAESDDLDDLGISLDTGSDDDTIIFEENLGEDDAAPLVLDEEPEDLSFDIGLDDDFDISETAETVPVLEPEDDAEDILDVEAEPVLEPELDDEEEILEIEEKDSDELKQLREEGAHPMTEAPDDTTYLEDDVPLDIDTDEIDLTNTVIEEPDLGDVADNPVEEPSLDNLGIDLDLEEPILEEDEAISLDLDEELPEEELELPVDEDSLIDTDESLDLEIMDSEPEEESFAEVIPEGFVVGPEESFVPSADDGTFDEDLEEVEEIIPEEEAEALEGSDLLEEDISMEEPPAAVGRDEALPPEDLVPETASENHPSASGDEAIPPNLKQELKTVLSYMDQLLESLPEEKIEEFAKSEYFETYKKLFEELGLV
ncbi:hypothetical protein [Breznakiella homolactica]|uniref:Uncharacterized protein n=1 Tax=Breznakiella homolactica TaxID=2798577 RepID=A0A7T8B9H7_9SPIR|nr:hypothetical protein [Breznakiella homolactica]QQO07970.1 hypothetical protein JFL75_13590 [Breznakiella homolactica]